MKKFIAFSAILSLFISCGKGDRGELVGVKGKKWHPEKPYGMTLVPGGAFIMGKSDDDLANIQDAPTKTVTVTSFYMDETEITNNEYRQFVNWVKDSIIKTRLAITADEQEKKPGTGGIGEFAFADADTTKMSVYDKYMYKNYYSVGTDDDMYSGRKLNQKVKLIKDTKKYPDGIVGNPIAMLDSLSLNLDKCCVYPPIPTRPQAPQENCRVFFSGLIVGGQAVQSNISEVYVLDGSSEFVGAGEYPDNIKAFPNSVSTTFDGIAIDAKTRLIIYSKPNFQGQVLLDIDGPVIINNIKWKNDSRYNHCNTDIFPANLQNTYPQSVRRWSNSNMHDWSFGSCKIMCSN